MDRDALECRKRQEAIENAASKAAEFVEQQQTVNEHIWDKQVSDEDLLSLGSENNDPTSSSVSSSEVLGPHQGASASNMQKSRYGSFRLPIEIGIPSVPPELDLILGSGARRLAIEFQGHGGGQEDQGFIKVVRGKKRVKSGSHNTKLASKQIKDKPSDMCGGGSASPTSDSTSDHSGNLENKKLRLEEDNLWDDDILWEEALATSRVLQVDKSVNLDDYPPLASRH